MEKTVAIATLLIVSFVALPSFAGEKCKCRFKGGYVEEGQTACIKTVTGMSLARCEKVLNNTSWKTLNKPCPSASIAPYFRTVSNFGQIAKGKPESPLQTAFPAQLTLIIPKS